MSHWFYIHCLNKLIDWCCCSVAQLCLTLCNPMDCSMPGFPVLYHLPELVQTHVIESVMPSNHLVFCHILLPCPQSFPASGYFLMSQLFKSRGQSIGASASASVLPMNIQGWFPLGLTCLISLQSKTLCKSLLQHHSSKASILWCSAFFIVQHSHPVMATGKIIDLAIWGFVGKVMSLLFSMLSRFVIAFLPRSKHLLISQLQSPPAVIWETK